MSTEEKLDKIISHLTEKAISVEGTKVPMDTYFEVFDVRINVFSIVIIIAILVFLIALYKANKSKRLDWYDMITRDGRKVSISKILQLVGGFIATWVIIKMTIEQRLTWDIFSIYLAYVASVDAFSKIVLAKYGGKFAQEKSEKDEGSPNS